MGPSVERAGNMKGNKVMGKSYRQYTIQDIDKKALCRGFIETFPKVVNVALPRARIVAAINRTRVRPVGRRLLFFVNFLIDRTTNLRSRKTSVFGVALQAVFAAIALFGKGISKEARLPASLKFKSNKFVDSSLPPWQFA